MGERFAREKRLKPLRTYLAAADPAPTNGEEMLSHMRSLQRGGMALRIEKVSG